MNQIPPDNALNHEHAAQSHEQANAQQSNSKQRKWINMPEELPQWLTKRVEFSMPIWALAIAAIIVAVLVFD